MRIDMALNVKLRPSDADFETGAQEFLDLLTRVRKVPGFDVPWVSQWKEHGPLYDAFEDREAFLEKIRTHNADRKDGFSIWAHGHREKFEYLLEYNWKNWRPDILLGEVYYSHPDHGTDLRFFLTLVEAVLAWQRPMHLAFGPGVYMRDFHPLDRARVGIHWIGWVPFLLNPSDVPEAEIVEQMQGGTLIVTQRAFWQALDAHPNFSQAAIDRAQEVEIRLNALGVLPTNMELFRGDWGQ